MRQPKKGDLIRMKNSGIVYCVTRSPYTKCYLDEADQIMIAHGLAEYAGIYESAIDVVSTKSGERRTIRLSDNRNIEVISEQ